MNLAQAHRALQEVLAPVSVESFLDETLGRRFTKVPGDEGHYRASLAGPEPERLILEAYADLAPHLAFHAAEPAGPAPAVEAVVSAQAFRAKVESFHQLGYTVRPPVPRWLSPKLETFLRALEVVLHKPVSAEAFWSRGGGKAPVHHDNHDIIVVHLKGRKRWFVSSETPELPNEWESIPKAPPTLERPLEVEVGPGDLLYLPRGLPHAVQALDDSLHLSIGFVPLTVREAIIATLDHLSDLDPAVREIVGQRLGFSVRAHDFGGVAPKVRDGVAKLASLVRSDEFVAQALQRRSSRAVKELAARPAPKERPALTLATRLRQDPMTLAHLTATPDKIDFSFPGAHVYVHRGAEEGVRFIAETEEFAVRDIPGEIGDDVRLALAAELLSRGFLRLAPD